MGELECKGDIEDAPTKKETKDARSTLPPCTTTLSMTQIIEELCQVSEQLNWLCPYPK